jgi:rubrerythrin
MTVAKSPIDILKSAILLEKRGKAFYERVAQNASHEALKRFFEQMASEEENHIAILTQQFKSYTQHQAFEGHADTQHTTTDDYRAILTKEIMSQISAAGFEAAAIAAAMAMEKKAVTLYAERAQAAEDDHEKAIYTWLSSWEQEHLSFLAEVDKEITTNIWNDNAFWPF